MRRNLRLDWRALALLGALLSIIIDWPGLVYAMPTILPTEAAPTDTINIIKNDKMSSFFPAIQNNSGQPPGDHPHQQDKQMKNEFSDDRIESENVNSFLTKTTTTTTTLATAKEANQQHQQQQQPQQRLTTINEKQQQHVNENYNSISDKREINDKKQKQQVEEITAIDKAHDQQNSQDQVEVTASNAFAQQQQEASLKNTHEKNSTINMIRLTSKSSNAQPPTNTTTITLASHTPSTTESSAKIQSTLMPTTSADQPDEQLTFLNNNLDKKNLLNNFRLSSSHHLAILSRTERSIKSPSSSASSSSAAAALNVSSWGMPLILRGSSGSSSITSSRTSRSSSFAAVAVGAGSGGGGDVRRSSEMSVLKSKRLNNSRNLHYKNNLDRNERSTVSHLSGPSRKIQLYIKNRFIQIMPDGTVNGTQDEQCDYTILQRSTVEVGRIKIQGVATCLYLCMDPCGAVYGSKEFTDDCVFNESMEQHNYNTYSSTYNSNARRKYYLALNRHGEPRKLQIPPSRSLGKLATYTNAIPETVPQERVEQLIAKNFGANRVKHGIRQLCDTGKPLIELIDSKNFKARPKCNANNSNNNSYSKNTLSRNLDKDNSLGNGQVLNNVPVANDKNNLSSNSRSSSSSNSNSSSSNSNSRLETNRDSSSSSSSPSSISINQNNGHISNSSSNSKHTSSSNSKSNSHSDSSTTTSSNGTTLPASGHRGGKKAGKKRKCRRFENEEQHNCTTPLSRPTAFTKRGNQLGPMRQLKCQNLLLQQQQAGVTDIVLPPMCTKKGGSKKQQGNNRRGHGKNGLGTDGFGPNNRRGKKLNLNREAAGGGSGGSGKHAAKINSNNNTNGGSKKKQKNSKRGGGNNNNKRHNKKASTTTTTTEKAAAIESTSMQTASSSTLQTKSYETTSLLPSTTIYDNYDPHSEATSDRGDREQRNVRYSNSMEEYMEQSSEDTSAAEDTDDDDDNDMENDDELNEDASYEDDSFIAPSGSSSHTPHTAPESSQTPLTAGADDFSYYDQLDSKRSHYQSGQLHQSKDNTTGEFNMKRANGCDNQDGPFKIQLHLW